MKIYRESLIWLFAIWITVITIWYTFVKQNLRFESDSQIIDNNILEVLSIISISFVFGYFLQKLDKKPAIEKEVVHIVKEKSKKDDLKVIEGIGPAIERLLNKEEIHTYWQLADTDKDKLVALLTKAGPLYLSHGEATWAEQAALLRDGKMEEFKEFAKQLVGGNRVS